MMGVPYWGRDTLQPYSISQDLPSPRQGGRGALSVSWALICETDPQNTPRMAQWKQKPGVFPLGLAECFCNQSRIPGSTTIFAFTSWKKAVVNTPCLILMWFLIWDDRLQVAGRPNSATCWAVCKRCQLAASPAITESQEHIPGVC